MSNNIDNREEWLNTLKGSLQEYTAAPPSGGWESLSNAIIKKRVQSRVLSAIGGISAVAAVVLLFLFLPISRDEALESRIAVVESNLNRGVENMEDLERGYENISAEDNIDIYRESDRVSTRDSRSERIANIKDLNSVDKEMLLNSVKSEVRDNEPGVEEEVSASNENKSKDIEDNSTLDKSEKDELTWEEYLASEPKERERKRGKLRNLLAVQFGNGSAGGVKTSSLSNAKSEFVASNNSVAQNNLGFSTESLTSTMATHSLTNIEQQTSYSSVNTIPLSNMPEPKLISGVRGITREYKHKQPLTFSLMVGKELSEKFTLESGLSYTLLSSDMYIVESGKTYKQQLHYIGLPLKFNWNFVNKPKFSLYSGAGALLEKSIYSRLGSTKLDINTLDVAATLGVGAQYKFTNYLSLYLEPSAIYYFGMDNEGVLGVANNNIQIKSVRSEYPLGFALNGGLRFTF